MSKDGDFYRGILGAVVLTQVVIVVVLIIFA